MSYKISEARSKMIRDRIKEILQEKALSNLYKGEGYVGGQGPEKKKKSKPKSKAKEKKKSVSKEPKKRGRKISAKGKKLKEKKECTTSYTKVLSKDCEPYLKNKKYLKVHFKPKKKRSKAANIRKNPWLVFLKDFGTRNPNLKGKELIIAAKQSGEYGK